MRDTHLDLSVWKIIPRRKSGFCQAPSDADYRHQPPSCLMKSAAFSPLLRTAFSFSRRIQVRAKLFRQKAFARGSEIGLIAGAALVGILSGCAVSGMSWISKALHSLIFGIAHDEWLSASQIDNKLILLCAPVLRCRNDYLQPQMNVRQAAAIFDTTRSDALAVVNNLIERRGIGQLSESHTLRRYSEELDRRRREAVGESV